MTPNELRPFRTEEFELEPSIIDDCVVLSLSGVGDVAAVAPLHDSLEVVKRGALARTIALVEIDIRRLQLFNSSCLKVLATFLLDLLQSKAQCRIRFIVDRKLAWQARSLFALERLAKAMVTVVSR